MKTIIKYEANDGTEFHGHGDCVAYEALCKDVEDIMSRLVRSEYLFSKHISDIGYVQQNKQTLKEVRELILRLALEDTNNHEWVSKTIKDTDLKLDDSWADRVISDCCQRPIRQAWHRLYCIDKKTGREYSQPYFKLNPLEATGGQLND